MAAPVDGFNAHAANIVAACYEPGSRRKVVESANCTTIMKK